jgi:hypothetical protein
MILSAVATMSLEATSSLLSLRNLTTKRRSPITRERKRTPRTLKKLKKSQSKQLKIRKQIIVSTIRMWHMRSLRMYQIIR